MADYDGIQVNIASVGALTATGTTIVRNLLRAPDDGVLVGAWLINGTAKALATGDAAHGIYKIWNRGHAATAATGTLLSTNTNSWTGGTAIAADIAWDLIPESFDTEADTDLVAITDANRELEAGDLIQIELLGATGSDGALTDAGDTDAEGAIVIEFALGTGKGR